MTDAGSDHHDARRLDRRDDRGPFDIVGDVHGCLAEFLHLLDKLGYRVDVSGEGSGRRIDAMPPPGRRLVFVGDLVNRGPDSVGVLKLAMAMVAAGTAIVVEGNHEEKLRKALAPGAVSEGHTRRSVEAIEAAGEAFAADVRAFLAGLPFYLWLDEGRLAVAHAGILESMLGRDDEAVRSFCLHGPKSPALDRYGLPERVDWAASYAGTTAIIYGHTPSLNAVWVNNTLCLDTACVAGNRLTALRWPERRIIDVPARHAWSPLKRPLIGAEAAQP